MRRIRVVQVLPQWGPGGAERLALDLACNFDLQRVEPTIVSLYPPAQTENERRAKEVGIRLLYLKKRTGLDFQTIVAMRRVLAELRAEVVHTHLYSLSYVMPALVTSGTAARIHTIHNVASREAYGIRRKVWSFAFQRCGVRPVSISQQIWKTVQDVFGPIVSPVIYNGVDIRRFNLSEKIGLECRKRHGWDDKEYIFMNVARMYEQKNQMLLINAFADVARRYPRARLLFVGDGPLRRVLEQQVTSEGLVAQVEFLGIRDDIPELLHAVDAIVLSSDWEGLPIAVLEGMAAAKPVIGTAVGGLPELIRDGETGILTPRENRSRLADAMLVMCSNRPRSVQMGLEGRKLVRDKFDIRDTARQYEALYCQVLERGRCSAEDETARQEPRV